MEESGSAAVPPRRPDASMTLLLEVTESPLDPAYADAAARTRGAHAPRPSRLAKVGTLVLALALGVGLATAASSLRQPEGVRDEARALLLAEVEERQGYQDALTQLNGDLTAEIAELSAQQLQASDPALLAELEKLGIASGVTPVTGNGYGVTLSDSAQALEDPSRFPDERVQAIDIQVVVNALWAGGAEAIAVNGTRVSSSGAIRGAGSALFVDLVPVASPYEIVAIGETRPLQDALARSAASAHLAVLRERYRIGVTSGARTGVWLPGVRSSQPRFAKVIGSDSETMDGRSDTALGAGGQEQET